MIYVSDDSFGCPVGRGDYCLRCPMRFCLLSNVLTYPGGGKEVAIGVLGNKCVSLVLMVKPGKSLVAEMRTTGS